MGDVKNDHADEISLVKLYAGQAVIVNQIETMQKDVGTKHSENRKSIHDLRDLVQTVMNEVWNLKVKIAGYSMLGGILTAIVSHFVENALKK